MREKTIRDADFTERYNNYGKKLVTGGSVGNPDLKAERSFSYEAGADWFLATNLKLSGTFFSETTTRPDRFYDDTICPNAPKGKPVTHRNICTCGKNIATVNTTGFEIDLQYSKAIADKQNLYVNIGLTRLNSESSNLTPSFYVSSHARFMTNFSAIYRVGGFSVSLNGLYKTRASREATAIHAAVSKEYFVLNTKAEYAFGNRRLAVFVQADNVFNTKYSDLLGAQMPGSWLMGGLRFQWTK